MQNLSAKSRLGIIIALMSLIVLTASFKIDADDIWDYTHVVSLATLFAPNDAGLQFIIGNYYFGGGAYDIKKAEKYFKKALDIDGTTESVVYGLTLG